MHGGEYWKSGHVLFFPRLGFPTAPPVFIAGSRKAIMVSPSPVTNQIWIHFATVFYYSWALGLRRLTLCVGSVETGGVSCSVSSHCIAIKRRNTDKVGVKLRMLILRATSAIIRNLSWLCNPLRCSSVGKASFKGSSLVQLYWRGKESQKVVGKK